MQLEVGGKAVLKMKYLNDLDVNKCIFVIDSITTAFMTSIISQGSPVHIVVERKKKLEQDSTYQMIKNFIQVSINTASMTEIELTAPYFIKFFQVNKLLRLKKETSDIIKKNNKDVIYIGPSTSTLMMFLTCSPDNIYYLYHGTGDYIKYDKICSRNSYRKLKDKIIKKVFRLPNSRWSAFWPIHSFSLCNLKRDRIIWIDYKEFQSNEIENTLHKNIKMNCKKNNILFCPVAANLTANGICSDTSVYDDLNVKILKRYVDPNTDIVFFKFHPYVYRASSSIRIDLIEKLRKVGIEAYDIGIMIPDTIGGPLLPIEAIVKYLPFDKLISQETSAIWNLSEDIEIRKILDISDMVGEQRKFYHNILSVLQKKCNIKTIQIVE